MTPELYKAMNSGGGDADVDAAQQEWERRMMAFRSRTGQIRYALPEAAYDLNFVNLHDASVLSVESTGDDVRITFRPEGDDDESPPFTILYRQAILSAEQLTGHPFGTSSIWLYDEIDREGDENVHRIMLGDGRVFRITFVDLTTDYDPFAP